VAVIDYDRLTWREPRVLRDFNNVAVGTLIVKASLLRHCMAREKLSVVMHVRPRQQRNPVRQGTTVIQPFSDGK